MSRLILAVVASLLITTDGTPARAQSPGQPPRIGVYDARAVAVAFVASATHSSEIKEKTAQLNQAKADDDQQRVADLQAWGKFTQQRRHLQGFAGAPVDDILARVADKLPAIARATGVDAFVRKGDYVSDRCLQVDVTDDLVKLFDPSDRTWKTIRELRAKPPVDPKVIEEAERRGKF